MADASENVSVLQGRQVQQWEAYYQRHFDRQMAVENLALPPQPAGLTALLIIIDVGLSLPELIHRWGVLTGKEKGVVSHINEETPINADRMGVGILPYAVWHGGRPWGDWKYARRSARELSELGVKGMTLEEYVHFSCFNFFTAGYLADGETRTLCIGSRTTYGNVPLAGMHEGRFLFDLVHPNFSAINAMPRIVAPVIPE